MTPPLAKSKVCFTCGCIYTPVSNRQRYCKPCGRRGGQGICEICGSKFQKIANTSGKFCSRTCRLADVTARKARTCVVCHRVFHLRNPGLKQQTCSPQCDDINRRKARRDCKVCGKRCGRPHNIYCSKSCSMADRNYTWKRRIEGSTRTHGTGYILVKLAGSWMMEHRHMMETILGRSLEKHERVHHKNGNRADNRPENLELWKVKKKDPAGVRAADYHCPGCRCFEHSEKQT